MTFGCFQRRRIQVTVLSPTYQKPLSGDLPMRRLLRIIAASLAFACLGASLPSAFGQWQPAKGPLMTRWAKDVLPEKVHAEYPRPQMVRENWTNLNGLWDYAVGTAADKQPEKWDGQILVPFPIESALSGVMKRVGPTERLWYRRTFKTPPLKDGRRLLLNFGAVDWQAEV